MQIQNAVDASEQPDFLGPSNTTAFSPKYYDILASDPRGVFHSTPRLDCFASANQRALWRWQSITEDELGSSNETFRDKWAKWKAFGSTCTEKSKEKGKNSIAHHMNTTPVVADLIELVERHGQWREREARQAILGRSHKSHLFSNLGRSVRPEQQAVLERTKWRKGKERIMFWGLSYGTILGQTFAAMHPERIERFVLDGVSIADEHYSGRKLSSLQNTDKSFEMLFEYCYQAGPDKCPLWMDHDFRSAESIKAFAMKWIKLLGDSSLPVPGSHCLGPTSITASDFHNLVRESLYFPMSGFPLVAKFLTQLMHGNGTDFALHKFSGQNLLVQPQDCSLVEYSAPPFPENVDEPREETFAGIQCTDFPSIFNEDRTEFGQYLSHVKDQSYIAGGSWAEMRMRCIGWNIRPAWKYTGKCCMLRSSSN